MAAVAEEAGIDPKLVGSLPADGDSGAEPPAGSAGGVEWRGGAGGLEPVKGGGVWRAGYYRHFGPHPPKRDDADLLDVIQRMALDNRH